MIIALTAREKEKEMSPTGVNQAGLLLAFSTPRAPNSPTNANDVPSALDQHCKVRIDFNSTLPRDVSAKMEGIIMTIHL